MSCATVVTMALSLDQLPDDIATLKRLLLERDAEVRERQAELASQRAEVVAARLLIEKLKLQIARLRRIQFGRRSEQHDARVLQLELIVEELETGLAASATPAERSSSPRTPSLRQPLPPRLPRETVVHTPACTCPDCGGALKQIGEDVAEQLEFIPEHFKVIRHVRPKFTCGRCSTIVQAPAPSRPIERGIAGPGLLAHVAVAKYLDHLPLYRQSEIYARQGIDLERSTLADWIGGIARLLTPLAELIGRYVVAANKVHADDTPVPVLDPGRGKTKTGRLWVYVRDDRPAGSTEPPATYYRYTTSREGAHPRAHLKDFRGTLQADAFSGFDVLYAEGRVREAVCWAHARRKFYDLHADTQSPHAEAALTRIQALYAIEQEIRGRLPEERKRVRQARAGPLLEAMQQWLLETQAKVSAKSALAVAINYALKRWVALTRYRDDGTLEIDNNAAERALRGPVLSRKNFLFAGADSGGDRAAVLYTLLGTAKLSDIDPEAYLRWVLERVADHPSHRLAELLPWNFARPTVDHEQLAA
jgi:transposase